MALTSRFWSNGLIMGSTVVVAYALLILAMLHHHGHQHPPHAAGAHGGHHHACPVHHFAWLALATGLTGLAASCTLKKRYMYLFPVLLLITELFVLVHISRAAAHQVRTCTLTSERVDETIQRLAVGGVEVQVVVGVSDPYVDVQARDRCVQGVRHAVILACLVVGVICTALSCCGSRLASTLAREEEAAKQIEDDAEIVVERRPLKQDPLADDSDECVPIVYGKVVMIQRV